MTSRQGLADVFAQRLQRLRKLGPKDFKRRLARWNHILIPDKKLDRDRLRRRGSIKLLASGFAAFQALTRDGRVLLGLMLPVGLAALDVRYSQVHLLWAMLCGLLLSALLLRPLFETTGLVATVRNSRRVAVNEELHFELGLKNLAPALLTNLRILPPFLPWDGRWTLQPDGISELPPGQQRSVSARARFQARGEHHLDTFNTGSLVLGGLAIGPTIASNGARFLVVPQIANVAQVTLQQSVAALRGALASSVHPGETDIAGVRPYRVGDELKHLHARTWARTGVPHVRHYVDERQHRVTLAVLTGGPDVSERVKEAALSLAAGVAARLTMHQGGLDTLVCDEEVFRVMPHTGSAALDSVLDHLAVAELSRVRPNLAAATQAAQGASGLVVIAAEASTALRELVDHARASGLPCSGAVVVEPDSGEIPFSLPAVSADSIEQGRPVAL